MKLKIEDWDIDITMVEKKAEAARPMTHIDCSSDYQIQTPHHCPLPETNRMEAKEMMFLWVGQLWDGDVPVYESTTSL